jgi:hypothetical protein
MVSNVVVDLVISILAELMRSIYRVKEILHSKWGSGAEGTRPQEELTQEADRLLKRALSKCNDDFHIVFALISTQRLPVPLFLVLH